MGASPTLRVTIYRTRTCVFCAMVERLFKGKSIPFESVDLDADPALRTRLSRETGWRTVPMVFVGEQFIGGFQETARLDRSGKLDAMLASEGS